MADTCVPGTPLIAETGGLNAMIVDSTALPEQAVRDIIVSAFQSAGQRCSALRVLYLQEDIAEDVLTMLTGAMDLLTVGDPWDIATDIGPVIDATAKNRINTHIEAARADGRVIHQTTAPDHGHFVAPTVIRVNGIADLKEEIFGPVANVVKVKDYDEALAMANDTEFGLSSAVFTNDMRLIDRAIHELQSGLVKINAPTTGSDIHAPFGGEKASSGHAPREQGDTAVDFFTRTRTAYIRPGAPA